MVRATHVRRMLRGIFGKDDAAFGVSLLRGKSPLTGDHPPRDGMEKAQSGLTAPVVPVVLAMLFPRR
jgi:hypothetical protein